MAFDANPPTELRSQAILLETFNAEASRIEANRTAPQPVVKKGGIPDYLK
jgi:hypothetical protein